MSKGLKNAGVSSTFRNVQTIHIDTRVDKMKWWMPDTNFKTYESQSMLT